MNSILTKEQLLKDYKEYSNRFKELSEKENLTKEEMDEYIKLNWCIIKVTECLSKID